MNHPPGTFAVHKESKHVVGVIQGIRGELYSCPNCYEDVIFRKGLIREAHFAHKSYSTCSNYTNESLSHSDAKQLLQNFLESKQIHLDISRNCSKCKKAFLWEYGKLADKSRVVQEHAFTYNDSNRRADVACIYTETGEIECIFEVCHTNKTNEQKRPEPWFEFEAQYLCDTLQNIPSGTDRMILSCIREGFTQGNESYGLCTECEFEIEESQKGKIYFNQRGAGCGKTYESIQLIGGERFADKDTFIYLTKMRSAKDVIFGEFESQLNRGALPGLTVLQKENRGNQYLILLQRADKRVVKVIIGTIDSFTYAIRDKNKVISGGSDCFQKLVKDIREGNMTIGSDGDISYASTTAKLTRGCLVIIDEGQDLEKEYIDAFEKIIDRTGMDTYIIGDKLQSILSEKNLFTHLSDAPENPRIIKSTGQNIIKRCHHHGFQAIINDTVCFEKYQLPVVEGVCSGFGCGYKHEDHLQPFKVDTAFKNIFYISPDEINACIDRILQDMRQKVNRHGYLPHNFMFIFPVVSEKNHLLAMMNSAIQDWWIDFFKHPESYSDAIMENLLKNNETGYWKSKIENKENDTRYYQFVFWHRSQSNQPINLNESVNASRILSIHAAKGNGCECVYLLGLSEFTLACHTGGIPNTLVYDSLFHVGMTRQKKYLFIGIDGGARDDVCRRFGKYYEDSGDNEPYIKNITGDIRMKSLVSTLFKEPFLTNIQTNIMDFEDYRCLLPTNERRELVDWGHHTFRFCTMKVNMDKYLWDIGSRQQKAKICSLCNQKETNFVYVDFNSYKKLVKELYKSIRYNIDHHDDKTKARKCLTVPILIFKDDRSKTDYFRYNGIIQAFCKKIVEKLQTNGFEFCPIECLLYCHLTEMIQHPYTVHISIMDIYRIISCYDDCYSGDRQHDDTYKCVCNECFRNKPSGFSQPHQEIQKGIVKHYESIQRMKTIIDGYDIQIKGLIPGEDVNYNVDKTLYYDRPEFKLYQRFHYFGMSESSIVFIILSPQFNTMNLYDHLTQLLVQFFFLHKMESYSDKHVYASIITLDSVEPITLDLTDLFSDKMENLKSIMKEYLVAHYLKEHKKIYDFFLYHVGQKKLKGITDKSELLYVCDLMKHKEKIQYENRTIDERIYKLPEYITDCFTEMDKKVKKDKGQRQLYIEDTEAFILRELKEGLNYAADTYLDIFIEDNPL
jgi:hypothetical protein